MPKTHNTSLIAKFDTKTEFDDYRLEFPPFSCENVKNTRCEICKSTTHKMKVQYCHCKNPFCFECEPCAKKYLVKVCLKSEDVKYQKHWFYEVEGEHNSNRFDRFKLRGMSTVVKELVEDIIYNHDCKPKKIHIKLGSESYFSQVDVMPDLSQIQSYVRYRRKQMGDNNVLDQLKVYIEELSFKIGKVECELVFFGVELGNGSDNSHFHLGFTTLKLIKRIKEFCSNK